MFDKKLEQIISPQQLKQAYEEINKNSYGLDEIGYEEFEKNFSQNIKELANDILSASYAPEPIKKIAINKPNSDEKRPIALGSIKDKIVQRTLYKELNPYFDKLFSDSSYAYRPQKSTLKALNRVTQYLQEKRFHIVKTDIDNFFEEIDHDILLKRLAKEIADKRVVRLISLFMLSGAFEKMEYDKHEEGVYQGDILSPLLSNIYLDAMDKYLNSRDIKFVRFADDFVMLFKKKYDAHKELHKLKEFLQSLHLRLEEEKTYITHISNGFVFLGVRFHGKVREVENQRLQKSISKLHKLAKKKYSFSKYIEELNLYLNGLKNYYLKIISKNSTQYLLLENALIESLAQKVYIARSSKEITRKKDFRHYLQEAEIEVLLGFENVKEKIDLIIAKGYEKYLSEKSYKDSTTKVEKKKNSYSKKFATESTLHINKKGVMLGISKNKFVLKEYGKVQQRYPLDRVKRIIFEGKGFSLSADVIAKCAENSISIDFINQKALPYASLITYNATTTQIITKQAQLHNSPQKLDLAKAFIKGKAKNQINYIKYLNKYHQLLDKSINSMEKLFVKIKTAETIDELMGVEGSISASYWGAVRLVLQVPFEKRVTQGATDKVNATLNYAYAILYGKVQHSLVYAGLSLNISFLHALDGNKPTLTFDMIEEFRTFIVDRVVISMFNKDEPIQLDTKGLLTKKSRQLIAKNIKEKLGSYTMWKKESRKVENIIQIQAYHLAKVVNGELKKYKPFIGKF